MSHQSSHRPTLALMSAAVALASVMLLGAATATFADDKAITGFAVLPTSAIELSEAGTAVATVVNGTNVPVDVRVSLALRDQEGEAIAVVATPSVLQDLAAGSSTSVTISAEGTGHGVAVFTAIGPANETVGVSEHELKTQAKPTPALAVSAWEFTDDPLWPRNVTRIPLTAPCVDTTWTRSVTLAGGGRSVTAGVTCDASTLKLTYPFWSTWPGTYTGMLEISDESTVEITLTRAWPFWFAALLMLVGALTMWFATANVALVQRLSNLHKRNDSATADMKKKAAAWMPPKEEPGWEPIKTALANVKPREPAGLKELLERFSKDNLKKNRWRLFVEQLPTTELAAVTAEVESIEADSALIGDLAVKLKQLSKVTTQVVGDFPLKQAADRYFQKDWPFRGKPTLIDVEALTVVLGAVAHIGELRKQLLSINKDELTPTQLATVFHAREKLEGVELLIKTAEDPRTPIEKGFDVDLRSVEATIRAIPRDATMQEARDAESRGVDLLPIELPGLDGLKGALATIGSQIGKFLHYAPNWLLFIVAFTGAMLAGYMAFYAGKPWGSIVDCIAAIIYGATTLAASLTLSTYFGGIVRRPDTPSETGEPTAVAATD